MKRNVLVSVISSLSTAALLIPCSANALDIGGWDIGIRPRFETGVMYYEFDQRDNFDVTGIGSDEPGDRPVFIRGLSGRNIQDTIPFISGGLTLFVNRFFIDASVQKAFDGDDSYRQQSGAFEEIEGADDELTAVESSGDAEFDRFEYAISGGYSITDNWTVYAGYKFAETDFDHDEVQTKRVDRVTNGGLLMDPAQSGTFRFRSENEFEQDGPFIGTTYGWNIQQGFLKGSLSASLAVAFLDGEIKFKLKGGTFTPLQGQTVPAIAPDETVFKGDTVGVTLGLTWRGLTPIEGLAYSLSASGYQYDFKGKRNTNDVEETVANFRVGISYDF